MNDDMALVREYAAHNSEEAFATLVSRHVGLVHSVALRHICDPHQAEEIVQTVFIILARKAGTLDSKTVLPGWLYRTTNYVSAAALKIKRRRERREQEAYMQAMTEEAQTDSTWEQLSPLLDGAMMQLRESDRDVLLLRFFQNKNFKEVGDALGVEERAAQKRVARALEKLRAIFVRGGVTSTTGAISGAISANSVQAAPVALAKSVAASGSTLTLIKGALKIMAWTKVKTAIVVGVGVLLVAGTTITVVKTQQGGTQKAAGLGEMPVKEQMSAMKMSVFPAILKFAQAHQDELPKSLADLKPYLPAGLTGVDDEHWEILQSGKVTPAFVTQRNLILLQQKNVPPETSKIIVYDDGHIEYKK